MYLKVYHPESINSSLNTYLNTSLNKEGKVQTFLCVTVWITCFSKINFLTNYMEKIDENKI